MKQLIIILENISPEKKIPQLRIEGKKVCFAFQLEIFHFSTLKSICESNN
jgi:hypothetical protein